MLQVLQKFMKNKIDINHIYNEFSLQFELGYFLRTEGYNVFFEKNVKDYQATLQTYRTRRTANSHSQRADFFAYLFVLERIHAA